MTIEELRDLIPPNFHGDNNDLCLASFFQLDLENAQMVGAYFYCMYVRLLNEVMPDA